jgi:hypothetical protein
MAADANAPSAWEQIILSTAISVNGTPVMFHIIHLNKA